VVSGREGWGGRVPGGSQLWRRSSAAQWKEWSVRRRRGRGVLRFGVSIEPNWSKNSVMRSPVGEAGSIDVAATARDGQRYTV
jgi:hypothetical protein